MRIEHLRCQWARTACFVVAMPFAARAALGQSAGRGASPPPAAPAPRVHVRAVGVFDGESGAPVDSAEIRDLLTGKSVMTSHLGVAGVALGDSAGTILQVRKLGYAPLAMPIGTSLRDTTPLTLVLYPLAQQLATVVVNDTALHFASPRLRGFEERRRIGLGHFVSEDELRKDQGRTLADVLRGHVGGVSIVQGRTKYSSHVEYLVSPRQGGIGAGNCYPDVYIDGVPGIRLSANVGVDLANYTADDFTGIEFYNAGEAPAQFSASGSDCGVLLLWTRVR